MQITEKQRDVRQDLAVKSKKWNGEAQREIKGLFQQRGDLDRIRRHIRGSEVTINFDPGDDISGPGEDERLLVDALLGSDHVLNQHETGFGAGAEIAEEKGRAKFEQGIGYDPLGQHNLSDRPRYGALNIFSSGAGSWYYGNCALVLHPDVLQHSTLSFRDSVSATYRDEFNFIKAVGTPEHFDHALVWRESNYQLDWNEWKNGLIRTSRGLADPNLATNVHFYAEVQIHGIVQIPDDILYLRANFKAGTNVSPFGTEVGARLQHWARRYGWPLVWGSGHEMIIDPTVEFPTREGDGSLSPVWADAMLANAGRFRDFWDFLHTRNTNTGTQNTDHDWAELWAETPPAGRWTPGTTEIVPVTMTEIGKRLSPMPVEQV